MLNPGTFGRVVTSLRSTPLLSIAAVLCAAIGVSATTAAAALFSAVAVRGVPFPDADRLVRVWLANTASGETRGSLSIPELRDLEGHVASFDAFLGTARSRAVGLLDSGAERLRGEGVTPDYFPTLGLRALHGRLLTGADFAAGAPRVTVISARFWASRFGGDPAVVGRPLRTEAAVFTIVGVAPPGFDGTVESDIIEFWMPLPQYLPAALIDSRTGRSAWAIARLAPGVTQAAAQAELAGHLAAWTDAHPTLYRDLQLRVEPMGENWRGGFKTGAALLLGAVVLLLVIAALNVAGLLVARTIDRRRELAMRAALGRRPGHARRRPGARSARAGGHRRRRRCRSPHRRCSRRWSLPLRWNSRRICACRSTPSRSRWRLPRSCWRASSRPWRRRGSPAGSSQATCSAVWGAARWAAAGNSAGAWRWSAPRWRSRSRCSSPAVCSCDRSRRSTPGTSASASTG